MGYSLGPNSQSLIPNSLFQKPIPGTKTKFAKITSMALLPWRKGIVKRIEDRTHNTKSFWIEVPELNNFDFKPGQFVTLDLPIHEKVNKRWRSYSISSWPDGTNMFELIVVLAPQGLGSNYLFNEVKTGSELHFRGAQGVFTLPDQLEDDLYLICTGTGIAPFRSMINHIHLNKIPHKHIFLIFGCRTKGDLLYFDEMKKMEEDHKGFYFYPTLSREHWDGHFGYVHPIYMELAKNLPAANFYLCGWKNMLDEAKKNLLDMGYEKKRIHIESYG
jgi:CDP-4-dehydro-6-deoxyglucose reductase